MTLEDYLTVASYIAAAFTAAVVAAGIVGAIGRGRLGRWLGLDVQDGDR